MSVEIIPISDHEVYKVNGFTVYKDPLGNWACNTDLRPKELQAFEIYEEQVIKNKAFKKHPKSIFKTQ